MTVNGVPLSEGSYLYPGDAPSFPFKAVIVPAGHLWVMGDHRGDSDDSRYHTSDAGGGAIPEDQVVGRAFLIIWPPSQIRDLPIPSTFGQAALHAGAAGAAALGAADVGGTAVAAVAAVPVAGAAVGAGVIGVPLLLLRRRGRHAGPAGAALPARGQAGSLRRELCDGSVIAPLSGVLSLACPGRSARDSLRRAAR